MHVLHGLVVFPNVADDAIEIVWLLNRAFGAAGSIDAERWSDLDRVHEVRQRVIFARDDQRVPACNRRRRDMMLV